MNIISLVGFIGCGKDTVGKLLCNHYYYQGMAFADALKDTCSAIFCWDRELLDGKSPESREWRNQVDTWWAQKLNIPHFTPRWALQNIGTQCLRRHFNEELWVLNVERRILQLKEASPDQDIVITDGRFRNELDLTKRLGGKVFRVKRGEEPEWLDVALAANNGDEEARDKMINLYRVHESEWAWIGYEFDGVIENDDDISDLYLKAQQVMSLAKIRVVG